MKIQPRQIESFVKNPFPNCNIILVYGPDEGLVRERMALLGKSAVADLNDPFNVTEMTMDAVLADPARISDELSSQSLMGGRRLIRIENAADSLTKIIKPLLDQPVTENLLLIAADNLSPRSSLRQLCEKGENTAAVPCYVDDNRSMGAVIAEMLRENELNIARDAQNFMAACLIGDRAMARREIEKLITYMADQPAGTQITLDDVIACTGNHAAQSIEDAVRHAAAGQTAAMDKCYVTLLSEGTSPVAVLRVAQNYFRRLHITRARYEQGESIENAVKKLRPPLFFKAKDSFCAQVSTWSLADLSIALKKLSETEAACKKTGTPVEALCSRTLFALAQMARKGQRSGSHRRAG